MHSIAKLSILTLGLVLLAACSRDADGDGWDAANDCNDADPAIHPAAVEVCDEVDHDCDGMFHNGIALLSWWADRDEDGFGAEPVVTTCPGETLDGHVEAAGEPDCDDEAADVHPGAEEVCDPTDHDCDGAPWPDDLFTWWQDGDEDGYGNPLMEIESCEETPPSGWIETDGEPDCDDNDDDVFPGAPEVCDAEDNDCDGDTDEGHDLDGDGATTCGPDGIPGSTDDDCDDDDDSVFPASPDLCDGIDNDCDGLVDADDVDDFGGSDFDGDGDPGLACGGGDCDDGDPVLNSNDTDQDGQTSCAADCDDGDPYVHGSATETCDGVDTDCDGLVDGDDPDLATDADGDGHVASACFAGGTDCDDRDRHVFPAAEYTSGPVRDCRPIVYPGFVHQWHFARVSLPSYVGDGGGHHLYFRGHEDQEEQAIGVATSADGLTWGPPVGPILEDTGAAGGWDARNLSNPSVVYVSGANNPWVMLYHAREAVGGTRQIGLASASAPEGPFLRAEPVDGVTPIDAPVLPPSMEGSGLDDGRTLHPSAWYDPASGQVHTWYNGRAATGGMLRIFHATSNDLGLSWSRTDLDGDGPDVVLEPVWPWEGDRVTQVSFVPHPVEPDLFEFWYTGAETAVGLSEGTLTGWSGGSEEPVFEPHGDCHRFDGLAVTARGVRYEPLDDVYVWYYGAQTSIDDDLCPGNDDAVYDNGGKTVSYVGQAFNQAPLVTATVPSEPASDLVFEGQVRDTAPDRVLVQLTSDIDGFLGLATVEVPASSEPIVQTTAWSLSVTGLSGGTHDVLVEAIDEASAIRTDSFSLTVP